jgi:hypothetical protein
MKRTIGWVLTLGGFAACIWRTVNAVTNARNWAEWRVTDPSGAELHAMNFWFESGLAIIFATVAVAGLRVLRRGHKR